MSDKSDEIPFVVVVGSANQDLTSYTGTLPTLGETVLGTSFETSCGGKGANQAVAAANLGILPVAMVGRVVDDVFGKSLTSNFHKSGVDFPSSCILPASTPDSTGSGGTTLSSGVASIVVDTESGDNMIIVTPGANFALSPNDVKESLMKLKDKKPSVVLVQLEIKPESALEALKIGKELGAITILNTAPAPDNYSIEEFYQYIDILIPNQTELLKIYQQHKSSKNEKADKQGDGEELTMAETLLREKKGIHRGMIVTLGSRGAMVIEKATKTDEPNKVTMISAPKDLPCSKEPVVDTIGAGDAFCGAFSVYLSAGLDICEAATKACGVASMTVRKRGAQTSYPTYDDLPDSLKIPKIGALSSRKRKTPSTATLTFVTGNKKKLEEIQQILYGSKNSDGSSLPFVLTNQKIDLPELQGADPIDIAKEKCLLAFEKVNGPVITEDTSLCFNALNGLPGPYIKWFLEQCGHDGLNSMLTGFDDKTAYAQTVLAFCDGESKDVDGKHEVEVFVGKTDGTIVHPRGKLDFGWDPVFEPIIEGSTDVKKTYAEMTKEEKNSISHRAKSLEKLKVFLLEKYN